MQEVLELHVDVGTYLGYGDSGVKYVKVCIYISRKSHIV